MNNGSDMGIGSGFSAEYEYIDGIKVIKNMVLNEVSFIPEKPRMMNVTCKINNEENK